VVLGAALLFAVELMTAKAILPWFGGSADVWTTCMLFFQAVLLLGYLYADLAARRLPPLRQARLHLALLALSLLLLPVLPGPSWKPTVSGSPVGRILLTLAGTVGLPCLLLSATSPLLQARFALLHPGRSPYRLFALSNLGSFLGLLLHPLLLEPSFTLRGQDLLWSLMYALFVVLCGFILLRRVPPPAVGDAGAAAPVPPLSPSPPRGRVLLWLLLAWAPSTLLLAVTGHISQNLAAVPLLWMVPLLLYLISFVAAFAGEHPLPRCAALVAAPAALGAMVYSLGRHLPAAWMLGLLWGGLFILSLAAHALLARLKPAPDRLTGYYLAVSAGGAAGGITAGVVAPALLPGYFELHLVLALFPLLLGGALASQEAAAGRWRPAATAAVALLLSLAAAVPLAGDIRGRVREARFLGRNFYGSLTLVDSNPGDPAVTLREMAHGGIAHGLQFTHPLRRREATAYFGPTSGIGILLRTHRRDHPRRVGVIGLGAGTLAVYGRPGDLFRFYEINPMVVRLAREEYTFLGDSRATVEVAEGDGRLVLEGEPPGGFDILVVDAFAGDAIPVHLLTAEAFRLYARHLAPGGAVAVNVTNGYLELAPVAGAAARGAGLSPVLVTEPADRGRAILRSDWVLALRDTASLGDPLFRGRARDVPPLRGEGWTDAYSSLWPVLR
jgi:hypothetical protein